MIGPVLIGLGVLVLALRAIASQRWPAWRGERLQTASVIGLALFIAGVMLTVRAQT